MQFLKRGEKQPDVVVGLWLQEVHHLVEILIRAQPLRVAKGSVLCEKCSGKKNVGHQSKLYQALETLHNVLPKPHTSEAEHF